MSADSQVAEMIEAGSVLPRTWIAKFLGEAGLILLLCVSITAPAIALGPSWPYIRTETVLLVALIAAYGWTMLTGTVKSARFHPFYVIGTLFAISVSASLTYGTIVLGHELLYRDLFEVLKCWLPVLFFTFAYEAEMSERGIQRLLNYFALATALVCGFGWAQFLNLEIAARLQHFYGDEGHNYLALLLYKRVHSTMANPNVFGEFLSWTLVVYTLAFLFDCGSRLRNLGIGLLCAVTITLTSSRYALLASILGLLLVLGMAMSARGRGAKLAGLLFLVAVFAGVFVVVQRESYFAATRFQELSNPTQVTSLRERLDSLWLDAGDYVVQSPWVGHGPAKAIFEEAYTDSEYLDVMKCYGGIGFVIYGAYYLWPLFRIRRTLRALRFMSPEVEDRLRGNALLTRAGFAMLCMALFMNIGMFTYFNWVLTGFFWMWVGLAVRGAQFIGEMNAVMNDAVENAEAPGEWTPDLEPFSAVLRTN
ncbi:MAG TPA: O-antigen ligase family protein [Candidatus Acidoferrum sp.]|nr:O-antigen ligase family protein [Candidatus Acidoferrum sp.]